MDEEKKTDLDRVIIKQDVLRKYFPKSYTPQTDGGHDHPAAGAVAKKKAERTGTINEGILPHRGHFLYAEKRRNSDGYEYKHFWKRKLFCPRYCPALRMRQTAAPLL